MTPQRAYAERLMVTPSPEASVLLTLQAGWPDIEVGWQYGQDVLGNERLLIVLTGPSPERVESARDAWLAALGTDGLRAFVV